MNRLSHSPDWQAMTDAAPLPQHWAYGLTMERLGARVGRCLLQGRPVQFVERSGVRLVHRAPAEMGLAPLARHGGITLAVTQARGLGMVPLITPRFHAEWVLDAPLASLRAAMRPTWRRALNQAGARMAEDPGALSAVLAAAAGVMQARGVKALPPGFAKAWAGGALVLRAGPAARMTGGAVFLIHGQGATYHAAWASDRGRAEGAPRALLWQAALILRARGVTRLDLGAFDAASPGLARFKLGSGAQAVSLGSTSLVLPF
jgi:hypothetical protein